MSELRWGKDKCQDINLIEIRHYTMAVQYNYSNKYTVPSITTICEQKLHKFHYTATLIYKV